MRLGSLELANPAKRVIQMALDATVAGLAWVAAYFLRFDGAIPPEYAHQMWSLLPFIIVGKLAISFVYGNYRQLWRYTGLQEALTLLRSAGTSALVLAGLRASWLLLVPYSIIVVEGELFLLGIAGIRVLRRLQVAVEKRHRMGPSQVAVATLVVGAGDTAAALISEVKSSNPQGLVIAGLLDDDASKHGKTIHGFPILGPTTQVEAYIRSTNARHVVIAMPSASSEVIRDVMRRAQACGTSVRVVPRLDELAMAGFSQSTRFAVTLADLLSSSEVKRTMLHRSEESERKRTVLVTGGAGYIGSHLVKLLLDKGFRVRVLDNLTYGDDGLKSNMGNSGLEFIQGDISSIRDVVSAVKGVGTVYALAALVGDPACGLDAEETLNLNYESTKLLVEACNFYEVDRLVFASSCSVYGASDSDWLTEQSALNPVSLYARTRILSEEVLLERCGDVVPVILRLATVFGYSPRMRFDLVVNALTARALCDGSIEIFGGGQWRPFVHCQDAAAAFALAGTAPSNLVRREIFNVGSRPMNYTISEVGEAVRRIAGALGHEVKIQSHSDANDLRNYRVSFEKISGSLGFAPRHSLEDGIREIVTKLNESSELMDYQQPRFSNFKLLRDRLDSINGRDLERLPT